MTAAAHQDWTVANQADLMAAVARVRAALERHAAARTPAPSHLAAASSDPGPALAAMPDSALENLCRTFGLSRFERDVLLLAAGPELDGTFAAACARAHDGPELAYPTFSLALAALPEAHWSAVTPAAPLRHWRLVEIQTPSPTTGRLAIDERILHYLTGLEQPEPRLQGLLEALPPADGLPSPYRELADQVAATWSKPMAGRLPVIELTGDDRPGKRLVATGGCQRIGLRVQRLRLEGLAAGHELATLLRLWEREAALTGSALLIDAHDEDAAEASRRNLLEQILEGVHGPILTNVRERRCGGTRPLVSLPVPLPGSEHREQIWRALLGRDAARLNGGLDAVVSQFQLGIGAIEAAARAALARAQSDQDSALDDLLWDACRREARFALDQLAQPIEPVAGWDDLVLPERQVETLREIAVHVRRRHQVYERWGFAAKSRRGLGISALFAGASGTGKTMAAEVLARELALDLYCIDLAAVVSKYIGETEKNLSRVFDAAESGGAILLFDEADALFGKRSEVKDSHDRYANLEVSYLLQRMDAYRGLAILTTNRKAALDTSFQRRLRFVVEFPFPEAAARAQIWRRMFPARAPTKDLDIEALARLNVAGGHIRNIALAAAFSAAEEQSPICMAHLLRAARREYAKLQRPLSEAELRAFER